MTSLAFVIIITLASELLSRSAGHGRNSLRLSDKQNQAERPDHNMGLLGYGHDRVYTCLRKVNGTGTREYHRASQPFGCPNKPHCLPRLRRKCTAVLPELGSECKQLLQGSGFNLRFRVYGLGSPEPCLGAEFW